MQPNLTAVEPIGGAKNVYRDVAPIVEGPADPSTLRWETLDGDPVDFEAHSGSGHELCRGFMIELVPEAPLVANTTYVIRDENDPSHDVRFTTGDDLAPHLDLTAPHVVASVIQGNPLGDSCFGDQRACVYSEAEEQLEIIFRGDDDEELVHTFVRGGRELHIDTLYDVPATCLEVRKRDAAGRRSPPKKLCGDALSTRAARKSDFRDYELICDDGVIGDPSASASDASVPDGDAGVVRLDDDASTNARSLLGDPPDDRGGCSVSGARREGDAAALVLALAWLARRRGRGTRRAR